MSANRFKAQVGNALLALGAMMLLMVMIVEISGSDSDPLLPAFAALAIGMAAVLDRTGPYQEE